MEGAETNHYFYPTKTLFCKLNKILYNLQQYFVKLKKATEALLKQTVIK